MNYLENYFEFVLRTLCHLILMSMWIADENEADPWIINRHFV